MRGKQEPVEVRFWRFVRKGKGCWLWLGAIGRSGYGRFGVTSDIGVGAHRMAYELTYGPIAEGMWVLHSCDNRLCVNPLHLFLGDRAANMRDAFSKGRGNFQRNPSLVRRGESHHKAKLTLEKVRQLRKEYAEGCTQRELATRYGVSQATISDVIANFSWKEAPTNDR